MLEKNTLKNLWLVKPDKKKANEKQCIAEAWVLTGNSKSPFGCEGAEIKAMLFWEDANIYVESKAQPKINLEGNEDIYTWKSKVVNIEFLGKKIVNIEFSDAMSEDIKKISKKKLVKIQKQS